jgi:biopolymer transport protein ExbD
MPMAAVVRPNAEPNVTPMIDVLLVLLIVFMVAVVQSRRTMAVARGAGVRVLSAVPKGF